MKKWVSNQGHIVYQVLTGRCNCYLISFEGRHLLVDTGGRRQWKQLVRSLNQAGVNDQSLAALVLTHCHFDHAENAAKVQAMFRTPIMVHRSEADLLAGGNNPPICGTITLTRLLTRLLAFRQAQRFLQYAPANPDIRVDDVYDLAPLGFHGRILHTPGHTPGSVCVIIDDEIAIVGDTLFGGFKGSVFPPFGADIRLMVSSWQKLLETGCAVFLPAHGKQRDRALLGRQFDSYSRRCFPSGMDR